MNFFVKHRRAILLVVAVVIMGVLLSACGSTPSGPTVSHGRIIQVVKHDDVERKERVCVRKKTERYTVNGKVKKRKVCAQYRMVEREISPEYYEFKLRDGRRTGWIRVNESTGESYRRGDYYP